MNPPKLNDQEKSLALVAHGMFTDVEMADAAAQDKAKGIVLRFAVRDRLNPQIILGDMLVAVFVGCEQSIMEIRQQIEKMQGMEIER